MFNNRMLAVAAVIALAVPTLGAAAPIVAPPAYEQLVEGHTVFTVIEVFNNTTTVRAEFAAAVAVLVREYDATRATARFPGVLWFNDQYLVNPTDNQNQNIRYRYPCGGAVMAVNAGDDDPRVILSNVGRSDETRDNVTRYRPITGTGVDYGDDTNPDYPYYPGPDPTPADDSDDPSFALVNVTTDTTPPGANLDTVLTSDLFDYEESYFITDPNDHIWIVDKYIQYTRVGTVGGAAPPGSLGPVVYASPVWVVNILGSPVFIPDDGIASCGPYNDLVSVVYSDYANGNDPFVKDTAQQADDAVATGYDQTIGNRLPYRDLPEAGYREPSQNGYCYNGNPPPCATPGVTEPVRLYNALLYFKLEDLAAVQTWDGTGQRDHSVITDPTDTNGCQVGTEWRCPGDDDNREGNSHPFHPRPGTDEAGEDWLFPGSGGATGSAPAHSDTMACPQYFYERDPANPAGNHGGSTNYDEEYGMYCGFDHVTFDVDIYFSPAGRPFPPLVREFNLRGPNTVDTQGSDAPFHYDQPPHHT